jgi:hypothetical protein
MVELTLLKLQVENASFTAHAPFSGVDGGADADSDGETDVDTNKSQDESGAASRLFLLFVGFAALAVGAVAARRLRSRAGGS